MIRGHTIELKICRRSFLLTLKVQSLETHLQFQFKCFAYWLQVYYRLLYAFGQEDFLNYNYAFQKFVYSPNRK